MERQFSGKLQHLIDLAVQGGAGDVDVIMEGLAQAPTLAMTRYVDYALSLVETEEGLERIKHYLFKGCPIQRNYASLYLNRLNRLEEWKAVKKAYEMGLLDEIQTYAR